MFSHVLVAYQAALLDFATKTTYTFQAALKILDEKPQYNFTILKDLTQVPVVNDSNPSTESKEIAPIDFDQLLFFKVCHFLWINRIKFSLFVVEKLLYHWLLHTYIYTTPKGIIFCHKFLQEDFEDDIKSTKDDSKATAGNVEKSEKKTNEETKLLKSDTKENATGATKATVDDSTIFDLLDLSTNEPNETDCLLDIFSNGGKSSTSAANATAQSSSNILTFDFLKKMHSSSESSKKGVATNNKSKMTDKKTSAWMDLFADLDPLANPMMIEKKIAGTNQNCLDA